MRHPVEKLLQFQNDIEVDLRANLIEMFDSLMLAPTAGIVNDSLKCDIKGESLPKSLAL